MEKVIFLSFIFNWTWACSTSNLTKSMIPNAMMMSKQWIYIIRKLVGVFYAITLVLSTLQVDETLVQTQVNTSNNIGIKLVFRNGNSYFFSFIFNWTWSCSTSNLTKSMILNAMMMSKQWIYMVRKLVGVFYAITLVLLTLQVDEILV